MTDNIRTPKINYVRAQSVVSKCCRRVSGSHLLYDKFNRGGSAGRSGNRHGGYKGYSSMNARQVHESILHGCTANPRSSAWPRVAVLCLLALPARLDCQVQCPTAKSFCSGAHQRDRVSQKVGATMLLQERADGFQLSLKTAALRRGVVPRYSPRSAEPNLPLSAPAEVSIRCAAAYQNLHFLQRGQWMP